MSAEFAYTDLLRAYAPGVRQKVAKFGKFARLVGLEIEPFEKLILCEVFSGRRELLVMLPRGNGKTTLFSLLALHHLLTVKRPAVYAAASSRDQARLLFETTRDLARSNTEIARRVTPRHSELRVDGGFLRVLSSDAPRAHGLAPTLALVDELHAHRTPELYTALKTAMGKRADATMVTISTAGYDPQSVLAKLRDKALDLPGAKRDGTLTYALDLASSFSFLEWACGALDDLGDAAVVKRANPATFVTEQFLAEQIASPGLSPLEMARYHGNVWTKAEDAWLPPRAWSECYEPDAEIPQGARVMGGLDLGVQYDCTAWILAWRRDDGRVVVKAKVWEPVGDGTPLDLSVVERQILADAERYSLVAAAYDKRLGEYLAQRLSGQGLTMVEVPQTHTRMAPASANLYQAIVRGVIAHDGDPVLTAHVQSGATKIVDAGFVITKARASRPIDALIALALAYSLIGNTEVESIYQRRGIVVL